MDISSKNGNLVLSATDLANHFACKHLTNLDLARARGKIADPKRILRDQEQIEAIIERGARHEEAFIESLKTSCTDPSVELVNLLHGSSDDTVDAMRKGVDIIVQGTLESDNWIGRADILRRRNVASRLGSWSYEVTDTKLARDTRAGTILQICLYSDIVSEIQGTVPEFMYVVTPGRYESELFIEERYRVHEFSAYYRLMRKHLQASIDDSLDVDEGISSYPEPVSHCDICSWQMECEARWRQDDHLSFVAGMTTLQRREAERWDTWTLERYAEEPVPLQRNPRRGARESYERTINQARVQLDGRIRDEPTYEMLGVEPERGLSLLPMPSEGDMFCDLEGDPFVGFRGLEYLFGWASFEDDWRPRYNSRWVFGEEHHSDNLYAEEKTAFEALIDAILGRWEYYPDMHVYHFGAYEPSALKRIMGRYGVRETQIDEMLRANLFIDLYTVVRQSLRASVERYSIKDLEPFFGYQRDIDLRVANRNRHRLELLLETNRVDEVPDEMRRIVGDYNRDDCLSLIRLRDWLEQLRSDAIKVGAEIERPVVSEPVEYIPDEIDHMMCRLTEDVPLDASKRTEEQHGRWLIAHMLRWHKREENVQWWEHFRLAELNQEELLDERSGISGLEFAGRQDHWGGVHRYRYPNQNIGLRPGDGLYQVGDSDRQFGEIVDINYGQRTVDIKKRSNFADVHPTAAFLGADVYQTPYQQSNLHKLGEYVGRNGVDAPGKYRGTRDLLLARRPRLLRNRSTEKVLQLAGESSLNAARRLVLELDGGVLAVQGPPGTGKTYTGARLICDLVRAGKKVGVTANSHKVIRNLLDMAAEAAIDEDVDVKILQKVSSSTGLNQSKGIRFISDNRTVFNALNRGCANVAAGTVWMWSRPEFAESVDVLIVDEAGQMSLANALAASVAAQNLVLLGDHQQLQQPQQAVHPDGTEVSALEHLLLGRETIAEDRGIFIPETRRLHPAICEFTSELFYEGRLHSLSGLENQVLKGSGPIQGAGLWFALVEHDGNQSASIEEADRVAEIYRQLLADGNTWSDQSGVEMPLTEDDILIVVPYNAHLAEIERRLPGSRVGTVDKFQGQEAPIVIYSMASSSAEDAPRGMGFLYDLNRLNVATSRARCACILVASPKLFEPECRTPAEMKLANALCRYLEMARVL